MDTCLCGRPLTPGRVTGGGVECCVQCGESLPKKAKRGTTNGNQRGSAETRRKRREWLIENYRADVDVWFITDPWNGSLAEVTKPAGSPDDFSLDFSNWETVPFWAVLEPKWEKVCRCYRCGTFLTVDTVSVDRIIPGCKGGTYRRNNIRPACLPCNSKTGGSVRAGKKAS